MLTNGQHRLSRECTPEMITYLYGEASSAERSAFESHLLECNVCTEEFAELSNSRFSVFEWQRKEFAILPTPRIVIPYEINVLNVREPRSEGIFAGVRSVLGFRWPSLLAASGAFAVIAVCGMLIFNYLSRPDNQTADKRQPETAVQSVAPAIRPTIAAIDPKSVSSESKSAANEDRFPDARPAKASDVVPSRGPTRHGRNAPRFLNDEASIPTKRQNRKAPLISTDGDEDDNSLRLTDLFDDIDTRL